MAPRDRHAGTEFSEAVGRSLRERLDRIAAPRCPVAGLKVSGAVWVSPDLRATMAYRRVTKAGELQARVVQWLVEDPEAKNPKLFDLGHLSLEILGLYGFHRNRREELDMRSLAERSAPSEEAVLAKAALRAAKNLGINNKVLSEIIGVSESSLSRMTSENFVLSGKPFELAVLLIRLYRSLDAIVGGDTEVAKSWLNNENTTLNAIPLQYIQTIVGLTDAIAYLDARRAIV